MFKSRRRVVDTFTNDFNYPLDIASQQNAKPPVADHSHEAASLKELEAEVPQIRLKLITEPEEAVPLCRNLLQKLDKLKEEMWPIDPSQNELAHRYDVLEISLTGFLAEALYQNGEWIEAAHIYERCIAVGERLQVPEFQAENLLKLGRAYRHAAKPAEATLSFERVLILSELHGLFTQESEALYNLATLAELAKQPEQALDFYKRGLTLSDQQQLYEASIRFLSQLGQLYQNQGENQLALENYQRCIQLLKETDNDPQSETIILGQISHIYAQIGDFQNGIPLAEEGLAKSRENDLKAEETAFLSDLAQLTALKAEAETVTEEPKGTTTIGFKVVDDSLPVPQIHYQRGNYYYHEGAFVRAISAYSRALTLDPKYTDAYVNRGSAYAATNHLDRALADYNAALELNPNDATVYFNRANVYRKRREYQKALYDYSRAIELAPSDTDAYFNRGEVYRRLKRNSEAETDFKQVVELSTERDPVGAQQAQAMLEQLNNTSASELA